MRATREKRAHNPCSSLSLSRWSRLRVNLLAGLRFGAHLWISITSSIHVRTKVRVTETENKEPEGWDRIIFHFLTFYSCNNWYLESIRNWVKVTPLFMYALEWRSTKVLSYLITSADYPKRAHMFTERIFSIHFYWMLSIKVSSSAQLFNNSRYPSQNCKHDFYKSSVKNILVQELTTRRAIAKCALRWHACFPEGSGVRCVWWLEHEPAGHCFHRELLKGCTWQRPLLLSGGRKGQAGPRRVRIMNFSIHPFSCHCTNSPLFHPEAVILNFAKSGKRKGSLLTPGR